MTESVENVVDHIAVANSTLVNQESCSTACNLKLEKKLEEPRRGVPNLRE